LRRAALILFILLSACVPVFADAIDDLTIQADSITYSQDGLSLEASGSVDAVSGDLNIKANHVVYYLPDKKIVADRGFLMQLKTGFAISGEALDYSLINKSGTTDKLRITYRSTVITGATAKMDDEKIELTDSSFNTCGLDPPHYQITSATTTLYPEEGWVLGYYGLLWINQLPLLPIPVYIFDLSVYGLGGGYGARRTGDVLALPEVGSNDDDGSYVMQKVPWIANRKLTGRVVLNDTENGGLALGVDGNWSADDYNDVNFRLYWDRRYWYYGGFTHTLSFGPPLGSRKQDIYTFLKIKQDLLLQLVTNLSVNERLNYQRVSMLPEVTIRMNPVPVIVDNMSVGAEFAYGHIREASNEAVGIVGVEQDRGRVGMNVNYIYPLAIGRFDAGLGYNQSWYSKSPTWRRLSYTLKLSRDFGEGIDSYISHLHYMLYEGHSPFLFEQYFIAPSDEMGIGLGYNFSNNRLSVDYSYYVPTWDPKDLDYGLSLGFHCYSIDMKYRAARKEFVIGVSLITR